MGMLPRCGQGEGKHVGASDCMCPSALPGLKRQGLGAAMGTQRELQFSRRLPHPLGNLVEESRATRREVGNE